MLKSSSEPSGVSGGVFCFFLPRFAAGFEEDAVLGCRLRMAVIEAFLFETSADFSTAAFTDDLAGRLRFGAFFSGTLKRQLEMTMLSVKF